MCRSGGDGLLEVAAHPGREPGGAGVHTQQVGPHGCQAREGLGGVLPQRRHGHQTGQAQAVGGLDRVGQGREVVGVGTRTVVGAGRVEADLEQHLHLGTALDRTGREPTHELGAVNGLHDVGVPRDGGGLVALETTDVVPAQPEVGALGGLGLGLLVAVLPDVGDAELGEETYVGGGEELGDDREPDLAGLPPGGGAGALDPGTDPGEVALELLAAVLDAHAATVHTSPARRPDRSPSRR